MAGRTIAIIGGGNMGTAILNGLLTAQQLEQNKPAPFSKYIICVRSEESVERLEDRFEEYIYSVTEPQEPVCRVWKDNVEAVRLADVVLLACQPSQAALILSNPELRKHLNNKLLLSICVGMSADRITSLIYNNDTETVPDTRCYVVHAMPNIASLIAASATVLSLNTDDESALSRPIPPELKELAETVFSCIGTVTTVTPSLMNVASVTGASTVAFFATALKGLVAGATSKGLSESDATRLIAQAMKGTAEMALVPGITGDKIRDDVMTPNGCTQRGVETLQTWRVEDAFSDAIMKAVERVFELGRES